MAFTGKIKTSNNNFIKNLQKQIKDAKVKVGVPKSANTTKEGQDKSITLAEVAAIHEFGSPGNNISERSFIRETVQEETQNLKKLSAKQAKKIFALEITTEEGIGVIGEFMKSKIIKKFTANNWEANAPSTVKAKNSATPLIDTGQLRQSIQWEIVKNKDVT